MCLRCGNSRTTATREARDTRSIYNTVYMYVDHVMMVVPQDESLTRIFSVRAAQGLPDRVIYLSLRTFPLVAYRTLETPRDYHHQLR